MSTQCVDKLNYIISRCKCGVNLLINEHRDYYKTVQKYFDDHVTHYEFPEPEEISEDVSRNMIERDTIVWLCFYPHTPESFHSVCHYDLESALDIAISILNEEG